MPEYCAIAPAHTQVSNFGSEAGKPNRDPQPTFYIHSQATWRDQIQVCNPIWLIHISWATWRGKPAWVSNVQRSKLPWLQICQLHHLQPLNLFCLLKNRTFGVKNKTTSASQYSPKKMESTLVALVFGQFKNQLNSAVFYTSCRFLMGFHRFQKVDDAHEEEDGWDNWKMVEIIVIVVSPNIVVGWHNYLNIVRWHSERDPSGTPPDDPNMHQLIRSDWSVRRRLIMIAVIVVIML